MSLLNSLQYCFCYMLCFFGCKAYELLAPGPGTESIPPALEGEVLTMDHQESPQCFFLMLMKKACFFAPKAAENSGLFWTKKLVLLGNYKLTLLFSVEMCVKVYTTLVYYQTSVLRHLDFRDCY